jgi:indole-3-glycerol phosphate synthase
MNDILKEIVESTKERYSEKNLAVPFNVMKSQAVEKKLDEITPGQPDLSRGKFSFFWAIQKRWLSLICEIKKASPSKGIIAEDFDYIQIAKEYEAGGASAISVLTEPKYFLGNDRYLEEVAKTVSIPCLRKDFIISEYQIYEAKVLGASAVLLITAILDKDTLHKYIKLAEYLRMDALVECHDALDIDTALSAGAKIIGINNRDLKTFEVDTKRAERYRSLVPKDILYVVESGITSYTEIIHAERMQADGALIGEIFMKYPKNIKQILDEWTALNGLYEKMS